jgi:hypothetical protein
MVAAAEGEPLKAEETSEGQTHASSLQDDAKADADAERGEV